MAKPSADYIPVGDFVFSWECTLMPPHQERTDLDRRAIGRTMINRDVSMFFLGQNLVHACRVRDITNQGAGIQLNGLNIVPSEFGISFDNFRWMRQCRLVWRDGDFVGAAFES